MLPSRVLHLSEDISFFNELSSSLKQEHEDIQVTSVPSPLRALGSLRLQLPDVFVIDLEVEGLESELEAIIESSIQNSCRLVFYSEGTAKNSLLYAYQSKTNFDFVPACSVPNLKSKILDKKDASMELEPGMVCFDEDDTKGTDSSSPGAENETIINERGEKLPSLDSLLLRMLETHGSDLHLSDGSKPRIRIYGSLTLVEEAPVLKGGDVERIVAPALGPKRLAEFEELPELDFSYSIPGRSRFRVNVFRQRGTTGAVFRTIPYGIPKMEELGLPEITREFADRPRGIVLVTGPTGSGKSTTLASMVDYINETKPLHIITLEDPIEFMHRNKKALVNQREIGEDTASFNSALKYVLRQDPDVILIGELRDLETISAAITAAETGHLVFGTLHTVGGPETIDRIIDVFPPAQQNQIRTQLSNVLVGVFSQILCPKADGNGRVLAYEVMAGVSAIANLIREGKTHQMSSIIQAGSAHGMTSLDQNLRKLVADGSITPAVAYEKAQDQKSMAEQLGYKPE